MDAEIIAVTNRPEEGIPEGLNGSLPCYDSIEEFNEKREKAWFWLEGVSLFVVGILGFLGNILAILILVRSENTAFNTLLI